MRLLDIIQPKRDDKKIDKVVVKSSHDAHKILNQVQVEIVRVQKDIRKSKQRHVKELEEQDIRLTDISSRIAKVTGGFEEKGGKNGR